MSPSVLCSHHSLTPECRSWVTLSAGLNRKPPSLKPKNETQTLGPRASGLNLDPQPSPKLKPQTKTLRFKTPSPIKALKLWLETLESLNSRAVTAPTV